MQLKVQSNMLTTFEGLMQKYMFMYIFYWYKVYWAILGKALLVSASALKLQYQSWPNIKQNNFGVICPSAM